MVAREAGHYSPPFSLDLLADLHAGALPDDDARMLWPVVQSDPEAYAVIVALDTLVTRLGDAGRDDHNLDHSIPADVATRLDRALAGEPAFTASPEPAGRVQQSPRLRFAIRRHVFPFTATLVSVAAVASIVLFVLNKPTPPVVAAPPSDPELTLTSPSIDQGTIMSLLGRRELGPFSDPQVLAECLAANGVAPGVPVLGSARVQLDDVSGVLFVLPGPDSRQLTALVVGNDCSTGNPYTLARRDIG